MNPRTFQVILTVPCPPTPTPCCWWHLKNFSCEICRCLLSYHWQNLCFPSLSFAAMFPLLQCSSEFASDVFATSCGKNLMFFLISCGKNLMFFPSHAVSGMEFNSSGAGSSDSLGEGAGSLTIAALVWDLNSLWPVSPVLFMESISSLLTEHGRRAEVGNSACCHREHCSIPSVQETDVLVLFSLPWV